MIFTSAERTKLQPLTLLIAHAISSKCIENTPQKPSFDHFSKIFKRFVDRMRKGNDPLFESDPTATCATYTAHCAKLTAKREIKTSNYTMGRWLIVFLKRFSSSISFLKLKRVAFFQFGHSLNAVAASRFVLCELDLLIVVDSIMFFFYVVYIWVVIKSGFGLLYYRKIISAYLWENVTFHMSI